jgi:hypothetical protein
MKTAEVKLLAQEVLEKVPQPYSEHVIEDVFLLIERTPQWRQDYDALVMALGKDVVNNWVGQWIGNALGKVGERQVPSRRSSLIGSYSILDTDAKTIARKPREAEALELMAAYFREHKGELPPDIAKHREQIVQLIMSGLSPEEAFSRTLRRGA